MKKLIMMSLMAMTILSLAACNNTDKTEIKKTDIATITTVEVEIVDSTAKVPVLAFNSVAGTLTATVTLTAATDADLTIAKATIATAIEKAFNDKIEATTDIKGKVTVTAVAGAITGGDVVANKVAITVVLKGATDYTIEGGEQTKTVTVTAGDADKII